ncbi:MAG TPA: EAL domain-containing protein [Steroidobacteraceae bacterium]|nr:EAL domain-containing protein [Steroidobacteraceae bacterium]
MATPDPVRTDAEAGDTPESVGAQLLAALPPMRLQSISLHDLNCDALWLNAGALGPDEHGYLENAIAAFSGPTARQCLETPLDTGSALFLAIRSPQAELVGLVMILLENKAAGNLAARILTPNMRIALQRAAILLRPVRRPGLHSGNTVTVAVLPGMDGLDWNPDELSPLGTLQVLSGPPRLTPAPPTARPAAPAPQAAAAQPTPAARPAPAPAAAVAAAARPASTGPAAATPRPLAPGTPLNAPVLRPPAPAASAAPVVRPAAPAAATTAAPSAPPALAPPALAPVRPAPPAAASAARPAAPAAPPAAAAASARPVAAGAPVYYDDHTPLPEDDEPAAPIGNLSQQVASGSGLQVRELVRLRAGGQLRRFHACLGGDHGSEDVIAALSQLLQWLEANPRILREGQASFSLSVAPNSLANEGLPVQVAEILARLQLPPETIGFELREASCVRMRPQAERFMASCERLRCFVVIDDFTFDTAGLELLRSGAVRILKVDPRLIAAAMRDKLAQARVIAIAQAAKVMGMHCATKQIDTPAGHRWLSAVGFDFAQTSAAAAIATLVAGQG